MNHIHLLYCCQVDITDDTIENAIEVFEALITSVEEVECSDAVEIRDILLKPVKEGSGSLEVDRWNSALVLAKLENMVVI